MTPRHCLDRSLIDRLLSMPIGEFAYKVVAILQDAGHEAMWVGGVTRDLALNALPSDVDIATSARPSNVLSLFRTVDDTAKEFGACVVSLAGHTYDVTTFREDDVVTDGRHPTGVRFGTREADAARRDATMNAMYYDPISRELWDPYDGLRDAHERLVRFIGLPVERIRQDQLRRLRMVRLRASIGGQYEPATFAALSLSPETTSILSGYRVLEELDKLLACPNPWMGLSDLRDIGVLSILIPELAACKGIAQPREFHAEGDVWNHLLDCTKAFSHDHGKDVRLATLLHDIGKVQTFSLSDRIHFDRHAEVSADLARGVMDRLQMPRARSEKIHWLIRHHMMMNAFSTLSPSRKSHWYYHPWFQELLQVFWLDAKGTTPGDFSLYEMIIQDYNSFLNEHPRPARPLLGGDEIMKLLHMEPGPKLGEIIARLHSAQIHQKISSKKEARAFVLSLMDTL